ncbi:MAG: O-antigen ligase family protein [Fibrobacter sp.]|uniref:O-antigen ligase family protein n=1 Tax=Fibrobacter sp. TaxID=35828 RepID=UPI0025B8A607|nr:O-antigen ligase family protein [Fibrobacter sp.]MBR4784680.1 O-antigen ligase family protein [Fibrobacter sp.]
MSTAIVYVILFSLLTIMVIGSSKARFLALFVGIVVFPLGISFLKSPTLRPQDMFLYGFLVVAFMKDREYFWDDLKAFPLKIPLLLILLCHFASVYFNDGFKVKQFYACTREFIELYGYLFAAFITTRRISVASITKGLFLFTAGICVLGILEILLQGNYPYTYICRAFPIYSGYYSLDSIISCIQEYRIRAMVTTAHPTAYGTLLCCLTLFFVSIWNRGYIEKNKLLALYALLAINLFLCGSRTGMLCAGLGLLLIFLQNKSVVLKFACAGICFFAAVAYINTAIEEFSQQSKGSSLSLREQQMLFTLFQIQQSPIVGNGTGYTKNVFDYDDEGRPINDASIGGLESIVFRSLIDYGFIGLAAYYFYALCLFMLFFRRRKTYWTAPVGYHMVFISTLFFTLSGHIGNNTAFAFLLDGLLLGALYREGDDSEKSEDNPELEHAEMEQIEEEPTAP